MTQPSDISAEIWERADILCDQFRDISDDRELIARVLMEVGQGSQVPRVGLTPMQSSVLTFVDEFQSERGFAPAYHEIAEGVGLASKSGVHRIVHDLVSRGAFQLMPGHGRSIAVVGRA